MFFWDYTFFLLIPPLLLAFYAQAKVRSTFAKYSKVGASSRISGAQMAKEILNLGGANHVGVEETAGRLSDHYDPRKKMLRLSAGVYESQSIAALGIAAHEAGHALQHHTGYAPLHLRNAIYPVASFGSTLAFPLFFIGFLMSSKGPSILMDIGILMFSGAVLFSLLTLPVEFNASRRAVVLLEERGYLKGREIDGARRVLSAAALTYVASTAMAAMQLLRMFLLRSSRD
ncbi:MAG: zinc metallopeptidase [Candidatus Aminicenantes bacterium]|nr:zinc metallopeptidase [Candidatus Aminicenantes bacterium]